MARYRVWDVEPEITDADRAEWNVIPLAEQIEQVAEASKSRSPEPVSEDVPQWLKDVLKRWGVMFIEKVVGFDAREMYFDVDTWDSDYRENFLLRNVERPFTVDTRIWRSMFQLADSPIGAAGLHQFTWADLNEMQHMMDGWQTSLKPCWIMAFTEFVSEQDRETLDRYKDWIAPATISPEWHLLGYDVADASWYSFLCDAGPGDEIARYRSMWGVHLNDYHLFSDVTRAQTFADINETREPMHGPYAVYGLYLIRSFGL